MWKITKDVIGNGESEGVCSRNFDDAVPLPYRFRMFDDDGILYYEGCSNKDCSFAPLDDFGMGGAGATAIAYLRNGKFSVI